MDIFELHRRRLKIIIEVTVERERQDDRWGGVEHDDEHVGGELARAAAAYCLAPDVCPLDQVKPIWPWREADYKPRSPKENLVRAAALILAELERLDRLENPPS